MDTTLLGRTGLRVSVMGLGCGGHSRLGLGTGHSEADAEQVVRAALDLGISFIDTAESYGTEEVVGRALQGTPREQIVLSTKAGVDWEGRRCTPAELRLRVEASLRRLRTSYIDVFHLHGVSADEYPYAVTELYPAILKMREEGKVRFPGITEAFASDPQHQMLALALRDDAWDVVMVGFNMLNQSARESVFRATRETGVGTLCMFAVRRALSRPDVLRQIVSDLVARGLVEADQVDLDDPLGFVSESGAAGSIPEAAYRFCRWEPGLDIVLSGTGSVAHLRANAAAINGPPLPAPVAERLRSIFAGVDCVSGN